MTKLWPLLLLFLNALLLAQEASVRVAAVEILERRCAVCHGATEMSGLDVRRQETLLKGGKRGPGLEPGRAESSAIYQASAHTGELKMPPGSKSPLAAAELQVLKKWIDGGAGWPEGAAVSKRTEPSWWSFKKLRRPAVPQPRNPREIVNPVDAFIQAKLEEKGLAKAPRADPQTLLRRAYFDLTGLPPSPEQTARFLNDRSPDAWEKLVDELLRSPRYGERWGRYWLDAVRYADSGGFEGDVYFPNAWRYRDYVIKSFNEGKPYDRFLQEQIGGDELWPNTLDLEGFYDVPPEKLEHLEARVGTTVYTFGPEIQESHLDGGKLRYERLTDAVDMTAAAFLGVSLNCARCHDHKFDPFSQKDYFRLQAVFAPSQPVQAPVVTGMSATHRDESYHWYIALDEARSAFRALEKTVKDRVMESRKKEFSAEAIRAYAVPPEKRTAQETELAAPLAKAYNDIKIEDWLSESEREQHREVRERIVKSVLGFPVQDGSHRVRFDGFFDLPSATVLGHLQSELVPEVQILDRGDLGRNKGRVRAGVPAVLNDGAEPEEMPMEPAGARYRKRLALWLTRPDHPLTARVMVNRIWQGHFGRGIVGTTNDFGRQGQLPTHPELLDWLASDFVARGWDVKSMHRLILMSDAYRMSSRFVNQRNSQADPENLYLWRMNRRRLDAESMWDSIHAVAGTLNLKMSGRPVMPPLAPAELAALRIKPWWVTPADPADANRRAVYILSRRNFSFPMFDKFDRPDPAASCPRRDVTTVAPQALWLLNNQTSYQQAREFAARLKKQHGEDPAAWIDAAWNLALARPPSANEKQEALALMDKLRTDRPKDDQDPGAALTQLCLAIFNLSEFAYVD